MQVYSLLQWMQSLNRYSMLALYWKTKWKLFPLHSSFNKSFTWCIILANLNCHFWQIVDIRSLTSGVNICNISLAIFTNAYDRINKCILIKFSTFLWVMSLESIRNIIISGLSCDSLLDQMVEVLNIFSTKKFSASFAIIYWMIEYVSANTFNAAQTIHIVFPYLVVLVKILLPGIVFAFWEQMQFSVITILGPLLFSSCSVLLSISLSLVHWMNLLFFVDQIKSILGGYSFTV